MRPGHQVVKRLGGLHGHATGLFNVPDDNKFPQGDDILHVGKQVPNHVLIFSVALIGVFKAQIIKRTTS